MTARWKKQKGANVPRTSSPGPQTRKKGKATWRK